MAEVGKTKEEQRPISEETARAELAGLFDRIWSGLDVREKEVGSFGQRHKGFRPRVEPDVLRRWGVDDAFISFLFEDQSKAKINVDIEKYGTGGRYITLRNPDRTVRVNFSRS